MKKGEPDLGESGPVNEEELGQIAKQDISHKEKVRQEEEVRLAAHIREVMSENGVDPDAVVVTGINYVYPEGGPVEAVKAAVAKANAAMSNISMGCSVAPGVPVQFSSYDLSKHGVLEAEQRSMEKEQLAEDTGNDRLITPSFERREGLPKGYTVQDGSLYSPHGVELALKGCGTAVIMSESVWEDEALNALTAFIQMVKQQGRDGEEEL